MRTPSRIFTLVLSAGIGATAGAATTCSGVELYSRSTVQYGKWEIRMKTAATPGSVSSFFTYYNDSYLGDPEPWREIDIEVLGNKPDGFQSNLITGNASDKATSEEFHDIAGLADGFHTYTLEWTPDSIVWRLDGTLLRKTQAPDQQVVDLRDKEQTWRMNLWASSSVAWVGKLDLAKLPVLQVVNWMRYSEYTPGQGDGGSNFTFSWLDDFAKMNTTRWALGDWTFDGNLAQFKAKNAVVKDGYLALALTRTGEEGVIGTIPADPLGSTYTTTAVSEKTRGKTGLSARATVGGLRIEGLSGYTGSVEIRDLRGNRLASTTMNADGAMEIPFDRSGMFVVRAGDRSASVIR